MEYLKIAQDLEMYGVSYFAITVSVIYCAPMLLINFAWYYEKYNSKDYFDVGLHICFAHLTDSKIRGTQTCYSEWMLRVFTFTAPTASSTLTSPFRGVISAIFLTVKRR